MPVPDDLTMASVAHAATLLPASITCEAVHLRFVAEPAFASVVVEGPLLVNRRPFYEALTGRLGYGRMLHFRRRVTEVVPAHGLVVDGRMTVEAAALELLGRVGGSSDDDILVRLVDGWGTVPASELHAHLARRHEARAASLAASEARFRLLVEHAVDVIFVLDRDRRLLYASRHIDDVREVHPDDRPELDLVFQRVVRNPGQHLRGEFRLVTTTGQVRLFEFDARSFLHDPAIAGVVVNCRDISERRALEDELRHQAFHDPLTRLPNRELFFQRADYALQRLSRARGRVAALYLDLDGFKAINDELGHDFGDAVIVEVANRLRESLRRGDTIARLGGDEFAVLADECDDVEAVELGERLLRVVADPVTIGDHVVRLSGSVGIATTAVTTSVAALLQRADSAMYAAKDGGRNRLERFDPQVHERRLRHRRLTVDLPLAVTRGELSVVYQPIVDARSLVVTGVEALLRWHHGELGAVPPPEFIALAEEHGMIGRIGAWVLERACQQLGSWDRSGPSPRYVSVNVSTAQLDDADFTTVVRDALRRAGLAPDRLQLEVTESGLVTDRPERVLALGELRAMGVRVAMDDFGTGYSSLSYLSQLPFDVIKLDQSFIADVGRTPDATLLLGRVVELAHSLGHRVTAEGVETDEHRRILRDLGCDDLQGYLFARPEPPDVVEERLRGALAPHPSVDDDDLVAP